MTQTALVSTQKKPISQLLAAGAVYLKTQGIDAPRLESEHLLASVISCSRTDLYLYPEKALGLEQGRLFWNRLSRRAGNEPLQYITGSVEFYGLQFEVGLGVFIPRPETELIVEAVKNMIPAPQGILDLCTGSGALAIALSKQFPQAKTVASDCSEAALAFARRNIDRHDFAKQVSLLKGDLFDAIRDPFLQTQVFDLIVCNPPYISEADRVSLPANVRDYEPAIALFALEDGLAFYRRILSEVEPFLSEKGTIFLELGAGQAQWLKDTVAAAGVFDLYLMEDWAGIQRIARLTRRAG